MHCLSRRPSSYLVNSHSDLKEKDDMKKESYEATWLDLVMETRPEYKTTVIERDSSRKESYEQKRVVHFVVRRYPKQTIRMGEYGTKMREYKLPYKKVLPVSIFVPRDMTILEKTKREPSPSELQSIMEFERNSISGICEEKRDVASITKDKPWVIQPRRPEFRASSLISPPWELSQDIQRRE
ncbi:telethonin [Chanos chanos]|uniref:Telethonin n=1 Tax=Chanos chanos TaxID=29144 RepID=A0A6J2W782_CHACN|nr:telethonin [Chanos chanos]